MWLVIGTRPEAIKLAPVARALAAIDIAPGLILTGQQPTLDPAAHGLSGCETVRLRCPGLPDPRAHSIAVATRVADKFADRPALVIVQGDTSSALGGAIAAEALGIPVGHVEAGLRTHDPELPWPEEQFRVEIDRRSDLLFAPTDLSAVNLQAEQLGGQVFVTGNTGIDAVLDAMATLPARAVHNPPRLLVTCHRRESWGEGLRSIADALIDLASDGIGIDLVLHSHPAVAAAMKAILAEQERITLLAPLSHCDLLAAMESAAITLSDSGGIQEEAAALGAPLLVLREKTERPEAIATGNMILVGTRSNAIVGEVRRLLADPAALAVMATPAFPYGDGKAAPRIAGIVADWLSSRHI